MNTLTEAELLALDEIKAARNAELIAQLPEPKRADVYHESMDYVPAEYYGYEWPKRQFVVRAELDELTARGKAQAVLPPEVYARCKVFRTARFWVFYTDE